MKRDIQYFRLMKRDSARNSLAQANGPIKNQGGNRFGSLVLSELICQRKSDELRALVAGNDDY